MTIIAKLLSTYTAWLCRTMGVTPGQVRRVHERNGGFAPRPEGALGYYY